MAETSKRLEAVRDNAAELPPAGASARRARGFSRGLWLLLVLVLAAVGFGAVQLQRNLALSGRVDALRDQLSVARAEIAGYQERLTDVRTRVVDLRVRLDEIEALLETSPREEPSS